MKQAPKQTEADFPEEASFPIPAPEENASQTAQTVQLRKSTLVSILCLCLVLAVGTGVGLVRTYTTQSRYGRLIQLANEVESDYYTDVDEDALMSSALKGYVDGLDDPYSEYLSAEEYASYQTNEAGQMVGIGVTVSQTEEGYLQVESVTADAPAEKAGLQVGDVILSVDGQDVAELGYSGALEAVAGEAGTSLTLTIQRGEACIDQELTRKTLEVTTSFGKMLDGNIGYIRISNFRENTPEQFQAAFDQLVEDGAVGFIFDLRNDGGGLVTSLEKILDPLLPEGDIAIATYRDGSTKTLVTSDAEECSLPMVVLVNENTASAAELFTASLQDFGKATVVGTTTFGKGIMQVTRSMADGGALTLTVATYQTTKGECYHGIGVTPDEIVEAGEAALDFENPDAETDPQLRRALAIVTGE